jgi:hypothetical protein
MEENQPLTFAEYQRYTGLFGVERDTVRQAMALCQPLVIEALGVYAQRHLWREELPIYPVMTTPQENGGWGQLMPFWFKPHERPIPFYTLNNWAIFALVYAHSFGPSDEARLLVQRVFTAENLVQVVVGTNLQLPFLPTTQGRGRFFRHGMLPFLLSILWLEEDSRRAWLRLHQLGAQHFIQAQGLAACADPIATLTDLEYAIFAGLERNPVTSDAAVAVFLSDGSTEPRAKRDEALAEVGSPLSGPAPSLLSLYRTMFGAITLGITALAAYYHDRPLEAWRAWILSEITLPYRMHEYGIEAIRNLIKREA